MKNRVKNDSRSRVNPNLMIKVVATKKLNAKRYFPVVLFIMLYKVVLTFESVDNILKCDHSNESY